MKTTRKQTKRKKKRNNKQTRHCKGKLETAPKQLAPKSRDSYRTEYHAVVIKIVLERIFACYGSKLKYVWLKIYWGVSSKYYGRKSMRKDRISSELKGLKLDDGNLGIYIIFMFF